MQAALRHLLLAVIVVSLASCIAVARPSMEVSSLSATDRFAALESALPGPELPPLDSRQGVHAVSERGVLTLANGMELALAGVACDARMLTYMQALFFGNEPDTLVYLPSGASTEGVIYAYVWDVALWELGDPDLEFAPATYSLNESGLRSGWCQPLKQDAHRYHRRYVALTKLYQ